MGGSHQERHVDGNGGGCRATEPPDKAVKFNRRSIQKRVRDYVLRTNVDVMLIGFILACYHAHTVYAETESGTASAEDGSSAHHDATTEQHATTHSEEEAHGEEHGEAHHGGHEEVNAVLFPWFAEIVGVFAYYFLSRYAHAVPYTAVMFIIGTMIGIATNHSAENAITSSASSWVNINGHVILLVFLPGLLYLDSYNIQVHLFFASFWQLITFAFPMVLAGTTLTALVAFYIFPYGWSFDLCMTFGSILAATDPVAVAVLLNELGAPPRLKMHVSGESLLNDGSAVVFYNIFSARFLYELGIAGLGENIDTGEGFRLFFQLAFGGACIGIAFGFGLLIILFNLNRRLSGEDSVVQVVATITTAYLVFFTSEILAKCSGIIAVVFCGVTVKTFGETLYNDSHLSHHFWEITEYLLNTLLFALGGCVWGEVISKSSGGSTEDGQILFSGEDWGYLFLLFVLVIVIRFFLVFAFYPITARIGIGSSWREAVFMSYGGLRGAVGIALALSLHAEVYAATDDDQFTASTAKLFGMVGGIALLTLVVNAPTCGPLLKKLGLVTPSETRNKVLENYDQHVTQYVLLEYVALLTHTRFSDVDFSVVKDHTCLSDITWDQLLAAVKRHKQKSPSGGYIKPVLNNVLPYLYHEAGSTPTLEDGGSDGDEVEQTPVVGRGSRRRVSVMKIRESNGNRGTVFDLRAKYNQATVHEERLIFIKLLGSSYHRLIGRGEVEPRGFLVRAFFQSLEYAHDAATSGLPLDDWNSLQVASDSFVRPAENALFKIFDLTRRFRRNEYNIDFDLDYFLVSQRTRQIIAFTHAHAWARKVFKEEFSKTGDGNTLTGSEKIVMDESDKQVDLADSALLEMPEEDVQLVTSHYVCHILLNRAAHKWNELKEHGMVTEREAGERLEEIEEQIYNCLRCRKKKHANEMSTSFKKQRLSVMPNKDEATSTELHSMLGSINVDDGTSLPNTSDKGSSSSTAEDEEAPEKMA